MSSDAESRNASSPEDARLVGRLRAGDADAFEFLVREHAPWMLTIARRFLRSEHDAQDALQDSFISIFRGMDSFGGESSLRTWMRRIVINASLMKLRSRKRRHETAVDELLPDFTEDGHHTSEPRAWTETAEELCERAETREIVRAAIDRLPESYRTVLLIRDIEGMDTEETARALSTSISNVKVRLHRARQALRTILDQQMQQLTGVVS